MGDRKSALRYLALIDKRAETEYIPPFNRSAIFHVLGDYDEWLTLLEETYESRGVGLIILKAEPMLDPERGMPRIQALMRKMNF